jgi:hypothetical protein
MGIQNPDDSGISRKYKHVKVSPGNTTQLVYSWVRTVRQLYKKYPQSYDPMHYRRLT